MLIKKEDYFSVICGIILVVGLIKGNYMLNINLLLVMIWFELVKIRRDGK